MSDKTKREKLLEYYLPLAVLDLQIESCHEVLRLADRNDEGKRAHMALASIEASVKARKADIMDNLFRHAEMFGHTDYYKLPAKDLSALQDMAKKVKAQVLDEARRIWELDAPGVKVPNNGSKINLAINRGVELFDYCTQQMINMRFIVRRNPEDNYLGRRSQHAGYAMHGTDDDFNIIHTYLYNKKQEAWTALLMLCGIVGGESKNNILKAAAKFFLGYGEDRNRGIKTAIMGYLQHGYRQPGGYSTDEEEEFFNEITKHVDRLDK